MNKIKLKGLLCFYNIAISIAILSYLLFLLVTLRIKSFFNFLHNNLNIYKFTTFKSSNNKVINIWIHASSFGESLLFFPIIRDMLDEKRNYSFIVTTCTKSSKDLWEKEFGNKITHYYLPWDLSFLSKRFIKYISPKLAIFIEADFWPNYLFTLKNSKIPILLLNGRMSDKSFRKWKKIKFFATELLNTFNIITVDSLKSLNHIQYFVEDKQLLYVGNLKYTLQSNNLFQDIDIDNLKQSIVDKIVILVLSTHYPEEIMFARIHSNLKKSIPNLLTIIIPRHVSRAKEILQSLLKTNLNIDLYSTVQYPKNNTDIFLIDAFGKTSLFFELSHIVYIGKSMFKNAQGGHNLLEPMKKGVPVIFGPYMNNFADICTEAIESKAAVQVNNPEELENQLLHLLNDFTKLQTIGENAKLLTNIDNQAKVSSIKIIKDLLHLGN